MTERNWTDAIPRPGMSLKLDGAEVGVAEPPTLWQIAGKIDAFAEGHPSVELGFGGELGANGNALIRIGRDRALWRNDNGMPPHSGWNADGWAALPVSDNWMVFILTGPKAEDHIRRFAALDLLDGSPSAVASFADHNAVVLRQGAGWQIWCPAPEAWGLLSIIQSPCTGRVPETKRT